MKKVLCVMFLVALTNYAHSGVVKPSADTLQDDLSFSLGGVESETEREVASEESSQDKENEDSERDIASDEIESSESKMQYWKY